ncbi:helix-turn-helix transcriptional regulator [Vibrio parahaemolyticus]|nr:helix-turn-helix transcriptional regulator [Vibrio parahaemolyticus]
MTDNDKELLNILQQLEQETLSITNAKLIAPISIDHLVDESRAKVIAENLYATRVTGFFCEMSQAELAQKMGVERTIVGNIERGKSKSAVNHILRAAIAMNVSVVYLAFGDVERLEKYRGDDEKTAQIFRDLHFGVFNIVRLQSKRLSSVERNLLNESLLKSLEVLIEMGVVDEEVTASYNFDENDKLNLTDCKD